MSVKREIDYEWAERKAYEKNLEEFMKNPFKPDAMKRMQNFAKKTLLNLQDVMVKVKEDPIFARLFVKNPMRQSIHEEEAAKFIQENKDIVKFKKLPASGQNSLFLHDGKIITKMERDQLKLSLKSVDFYWEVKTKTGKPLKFYASHKYTNEEGGVQDHQYIEQRKFLNNARSSDLGDNVFFLALCEGQFYRKLSKKDSSSRIDFMNDNDICDQSRALLLSDLDEFIAEKKNEYELKNNHIKSISPEENKKENKKPRKLRKPLNH